MSIDIPFRAGRLLTQVMSQQRAEGSKIAIRARLDHRLVLPVVQ